MVKKNLSSRHRTQSISSLLGFSYPTLHTGKRWYVDFYAYDPLTQTMKRKKFYIGKDLKQKEKKAQAALIIEASLHKLQKGWNPWVENADSRSFADFDQVLDRYLDYIGKAGRAKTRHSYASRVNILREYISTMAVPIRYVYQYTTEFITGFLDYIFLDRECGARTRNNYRGWCGALGEWLVERKYIEANPATPVKKIAETPKRRRALSEDMLLRMKEHLEKADRHFLLACMMEYYTFIRPTELSHLKIKDFSIINQTVFVSGEISKNKRSCNVAVNEVIIKMMLDLGVFSSPGEWYLFGKGFKPSPDRNGADQFNKRWSAMRNALGWEDCYQFYSLKDSGIRDLANGQGIVIARDQARHTDISTTNKYLCGRDSKVHEESKTFKGSLG